ncbi:hypothetical protein LXA43DRAFT_1095237 [Ganoderma leucocontextum]|nr:hypothetical protein LXA43DRAFT_1095237 [Ganoderma leucocontextum]
MLPDGKMITVVWFLREHRQSSHDCMYGGGVGHAPQLMLDMGMNNPCMELSVLCDPHMGAMMMSMTESMSMSSSTMPMPSMMPRGSMMMPSSSSASMMASCMSPMAMGVCGNANGHAMGMDNNSTGMHSMRNANMYRTMMRVIMPMMMTQDGMGVKMCMMMGRQDMMKMCKLVVLKLEPMFACMDMSNMEALKAAMKTAQPLWQCLPEHLQACTTVMVRRNPMTNEMLAMVDGTVRGMMGIEDSDNGLPEFRMRNRSQLREHGCWESLDAFEGPILMFWLLWLPYPVRHLEVHDDGEVEDTPPDMLSDALPPARATRLDITLDH